jgi:LPS-assembly lipoprotein
MRSRISPSTVMLAVTTVVLAFGLAGCGTNGFRPMYAASANGGGLADRLAQIEITTIPGRAGQIIRNELMFQTRGGGGAGTAAPSMRLNIAVREKELSTLVNREGDALGRVYTVTAAFQLVDMKTHKTLLKGESFGRASYDRFEPIYANVRAKKDAQRRSAKSIAQDIKSRLEAFLASG